MPKINVYLPDELADAVKEAGVPVSAICQRALEQAVRRITSIRETVLSNLDVNDGAGRLPHFTERSRAAVKLAVEQARSGRSPSLGTEHLLGGMLAEGGNLALHVLKAMEIEPEQVARDLALQAPAPVAEGEEAARHFSSPAANALELAVTEAVAFGHNYVGCEHLLLGLVTESEGTAGQVLRALGAEPRLTRRAVSAALAGYVHLRAQSQESGSALPAAAAKALATAVRQEVQPLIRRMERLEERLNLAPEN
jgi:ATP-dependent Clp protease ATP-binding subunit ClpC